MGKIITSKGAIGQTTRLATVNMVNIRYKTKAVKSIKPLTIMPTTLDTILSTVD
ncbi:MAG TPA: hypothetical protein VFX79_01935 [Candidatus Saccharimonadales bacterium]|nr:hypothetical protein [Candidatus Saccharimonadales bacterium]